MTGNGDAVMLYSHLTRDCIVLYCMYSDLFAMVRTHFIRSAFLIAMSQSILAILLTVDVEWKDKVVSQVWWYADRAKYGFEKTDHGLGAMHPRPFQTTITHIEFCATKKKNVFHIKMLTSCMYENTNGFASEGTDCSFGVFRQINLG